jgi:hypothetical protein
VDSHVLRRPAADKYNGALAGDLCARPALPPAVDRFIGRTVGRREYCCTGHPAPRPLRNHASDRCVGTLTHFAQLALLAGGRELLDAAAAALRDGPVASSGGQLQTKHEIARGPSLAVDHAGARAEIAN